MWPFKRQRKVLVRDTDGEIHILPMIIIGNKQFSRRNGKLIQLVADGKVLGCRWASCWEPLEE